METKSWYAIRALENSKTAEISIYDEIGGWGVSARSFISQLNALEAENITLRIHSPGGSILEGNAIYNALVRHPAKINVSIDGLAASMASVIACAGDSITMASNALFMIHNPWTYASGEAEELRKTADLLDKMKENIVGAYQKRSGLGKKALSEMMDQETWMTAAEAVENGFVDQIGEKVEAKNSFDLSAFKNFKAAQARLTAETEDMTEQERTLLQKVADFFKSDKSKEDKIVELEGVISKNDEATEELVTAHQTAVITKDTEIAELRQKVAAAEEKAVANEKEFENRVNTEVVRRAASAGIKDPVKRDPTVNTDMDVQTLRENIASSTDPKERYELGLRLRELRSKKAA